MLSLLKKIELHFCKPIPSNAVLTTDTHHDFVLFGSPFLCFLNVLSLSLPRHLPPPPFLPSSLPRAYLSPMGRKTNHLNPHLPSLFSLWFPSLSSLTNTIASSSSLPPPSSCHLHFLILIVSLTHGEKTPASCSPSLFLFTITFNISPSSFPPSSLPHTY